MSFQNENIGIMDEAYFVSRGEILKWLNDLLQLNLTKIEQLGSGAVYCQVIDVVHPGKISIAKVNWKANNNYEFIGNYRILQDAFHKCGIKRYVEVEKLAKAKYQDNLEFAQWLKRYYDLNCGDRGNNYLAEERRGGVNPSFGFAEKIVVPKTYNGAGMVIPKKESPPKPATKATEPTPPPPPPKKAPVPSHRPVASEAANRPVRKLEARSPKSKEESKGAKELHTLYAQKEHLEERIELMQEQLQRFNQQSYQKQQQLYEIQQREQSMAKKLKQMEDKLLMVDQILKAQEGAELKVQMISEIVKVPQKPAQEEHQGQEEF